MKELAIIKGVGIGIRDCNAPVLWFSVEMLHGGALQIFPWNEARQVILDFSVRDVRDLEGRACIVDSGDGGPGSTVEYVGPQ